MPREPISLTPQDVTRFEAKFAKADGCWNWTAGLGNGYGQFAPRHKTKRAHRIAYELYVGPIPPGMCVLHRCDNRACVNPVHLWLGTWADNNRDRTAKGRSADIRGERNGQAKLTASDVLQIRELIGQPGCTQPSLAHRFGMDQSAISLIVNGKRWSHIKGRGKR